MSLETNTISELKVITQVKEVVVIPNPEERWKRARSMAEEILGESICSTRPMSSIIRKHKENILRKKMRVNFP